MQSTELTFGSHLRHEQRSSSGNPLLPKIPPVSGPRPGNYDTNKKHYIKKMKNGYSMAQNSTDILKNEKDKFMGLGGFKQTHQRYQSYG